MSTRAPTPGDAQGPALRPVDRALMDAATLEARSGTRGRAIIRFHELDEPVQRMLNAFEPESYAPPHAHLSPPKVEVFLVLRGRGLVVRFDPTGAVLEALELDAGGPAHGVEIPPGAWHCALALEPGTVFYEIKQGPYDPATDKTLAPWAPPESDVAAGRDYLARLRRALGLPPLAAHAPAPETIDEEDDDLL
jgi:cupin fold WbuC family metalloprotein